MTDWGLFGEGERHTVKSQEWTLHFCPYRAWGASRTLLVSSLTSYLYRSCKMVSHTTCLQNVRKRRFEVSLGGRRSGNKDRCGRDGEYRNDGHGVKGVTIVHGPLKNVLSFLC